ncbi:MAG: type II secretion system protein GspC [Thermodesulfovibrionales bacterium]
MKIMGVIHNLKDPRIIRAINYILGFLLLLAVLFFIRDTITAFSAPMGKGMPPESKAQNAVRPAFQDYAAIVKSNPFGPPGSELKQLSTATAEKSAARSDLILVGTVAGSAAHSYAIFADKANNQEIYKTGGMVRGLGKIVRVDKDRVIVSDSGVTTEIHLADIIKITEAKAPQEVGKPASFVQNVGEGTYVVDQNRIQQALEKPNQIMTDARLLPNVADGKQQGFMLSEVKPGGIYQSLGLQNGDVLLRINEYNISNPESALQAFTALKGMDRVRLDIVRNNAKMTMTYQIK